MSGATSEAVTGRMSGGAGDKREELEKEEIEGYSGFHRRPVVVFIETRLLGGVKIWRVSVSPVWETSTLIPRFEINFREVNGLFGEVTMGWLSANLLCLPFGLLSVKWILNGSYTRWHGHVRSCSEYRTGGEKEARSVQLDVL